MPLGSLESCSNGEDCQALPAGSINSPETWQVCIFSAITSFTFAEVPEALIIQLEVRLRLTLSRLSQLHMKSIIFGSLIIIRASSFLFK